MMKMWKRGLALTLCMLESTILGGTLFGWPSLVYVLQADELYVDYCIHKPDTKILSIINNSSALIRSNDINNTATVSSINITDISVIENGSTTNNSADPFEEAVATTRTLDITNQGETTDYANNDDDNVTVRPQTAIRCKEQKVALSLSYTVATVSFGLSGLPTGLFFDRFGLRITRTIAVILAILGYCQLAFAKRGLEWMILTGAIFIGSTCYTLLITNFHVAKLGGKRSSLAVAVYAAGVNSSFAYQLVKIAYDAGVMRFIALLTLGSLWLVVLFTSWCLLPKFKIDEKELGFEKHSLFAMFAISPGSITQTKIAPNPGGEQGKEKSLWRFMTSATFISFLFWFCVDCTRHNMMIIGYDSWITEIVNGDLMKVTFYTDFLAYGTLAGSLLTPINGIITDFMFSKYGLRPGGRSLTLLPAALMSSFMMALVNIPLLFHNETAIYAAVVLFVIGKPLFLSTVPIFMGVIPPMKYYGVLFGIRSVAGGVASFMVYPYLRWVAAVQSNIPVTIMILVSNILAFSFPFMLYYDRLTEVRRTQKMRQQNMTENVYANKQLGKTSVSQPKVPESEQNDP